MNPLAFPKHENPVAVVREQANILERKKMFCSMPNQPALTTRSASTCSFNSAAVIDLRCSQPLLADGAADQNTISSDNSNISFSRTRTARASRSAGAVSYRGQVDSIWVSEWFHGGDGNVVARRSTATTLASRECRIGSTPMGYKPHSSHLGKHLLFGYDKHNPLPKSKTSRSTTINSHRDHTFKTVWWKRKPRLDLLLRREHLCAGGL